MSAILSGQRDVYFEAGGLVSAFDAADSNYAGGEIRFHGSLYSSAANFAARAAARGQAVFLPGSSLHFHAARHYVEDGNGHKQAVPDWDVTQREIENYHPAIRAEIIRQGGLHIDGHVVLTRQWLLAHGVGRGSAGGHDPHPTGDAPRFAKVEPAANKAPAERGFFDALFGRNEPERKSVAADDVPAPTHSHHRRHDPALRQQQPKVAEEPSGWSFLGNHQEAAAPVPEHHQRGRRTALRGQHPAEAGPHSHAAENARTRVAAVEAPPVARVFGFAQ